MPEPEFSERVERCKRCGSEIIEKPDSKRSCSFVRSFGMVKTCRTHGVLKPDQIALVPLNMEMGFKF